MTFFLQKKQAKNMKNAYIVNKIVIFGLNKPKMTKLIQDP